MDQSEHASRSATACDADAAGGATACDEDAAMLETAIVRKVREGAVLSVAFLEQHATRLAACARELAARLDGGARMWVMGNGGSACDAQHVAIEFLHPIIEKRRAFAVHALTADGAVMTAIGNDKDFSCVFADQLELLADPADVALGISTSGASANVNRALERARVRGLLTIGFSGRDGGRMEDTCRYCFTVPSWSIHRVQETHTVLLHLLWDLVHVSLGEDDVL
jgi:D-sedoheptulose 7-phosphate isomerase